LKSHFHIMPLIDREPDLTLPGVYDAVLLRIHVIGVRPPIWRSIVVHPSTDQVELHRLICTLLGWDEASGHDFDGKATNKYGKGTRPFNGIVGELAEGDVTVYTNHGPGGMVCRITVTRKGMHRSPNLPLLIGGMRTLKSDGFSPYDITTPIIDLKLRSFIRYDDLIPDTDENLVEHWRATALSSSDNPFDERPLTDSVIVGKFQRRRKGPLRPVADKVPPGAQVELRINLKGMPVPVWRQILVNSAISFHCLHRCIQVAFGWGDCHLYCFSAGDSLIESFIEDDVVDLPQGTEAIDSMTIRLRDIMTGKGWSIRYDYDFGDGWKHDVKVVNVHEGLSPLLHPELLKGSGTCPPEDCGGAYGYIGLIKALNDPRHPEHESLTEYMGVDHLDPNEFDLEKAQSRFRSAWLTNI
jgi:hypothetical protein